MIRTWTLPAIAVLGIIFAGWSSMRDHGAAQPLAATKPPEPVYDERISGSGLIEPASESIAVGAPVSGIARVVNVAIGDNVKRGAELFHLDDRIERAALAQATAELELVRQQHGELIAQPRADDLPPAVARVARARSELAEATDYRDRAETTAPAGAVSREELIRRRFAVQNAEARLAEAEANLARLKAGAWAPEVATATARVAAAEAKVEAARTACERLVVTAPLDATVLRVDIRAGEFVRGDNLITLGDLSTLHLRVDIDEQDAWRFSRASEGSATVRGNPQVQHALTLVRVEPFVRPKRSLTGDSVERIDTRVLQAIFTIADPAGLYVGQQMDAQIKASPESRSSAH